MVSTAITTGKGYGAWQILSILLQEVVSCEAIMYYEGVVLPLPLNYIIPHLAMLMWIWLDIK